MPTGTSDYWLNEVFIAFENHPDGARAPSPVVARKIEEVARERVPDGERDNYPAERTIRGLRDKFKELSAEERAALRYVRWPETFEAGILPWELSRLILDVLVHDQVMGMPTRSTVRAARWYGYVASAAPELHDYVQRLASLALTDPDTLSRTYRHWSGEEEARGIPSTEPDLTLLDALELMQVPRALAVQEVIEGGRLSSASLRGLEEWLAFRAWTKEGREHYQREVVDPSFPISPEEMDEDFAPARDGTAYCTRRGLPHSLRQT